MTTVQITLPDVLAREVSRAGLLAPAQIEIILRERLAAARIDRLKSVRTTLAAEPLPAMKSVAKSTPTAPSNAVRLVADTNNVISGLLWGGTPGRLIDLAVQGRIKFVTSLPVTR